MYEMNSGIYDVRQLEFIVYSVDQCKIFASFKKQTVSLLHHHSASMLVFFLLLAALQVGVQRMSQLHHKSSGEKISLNSFPRLKEHIKITWSHM